jgi:lipid-A-disaccharide synthase
VKNKKLYIIAGEASGDLHGGNLVKALKAKALLEIRGWGGDRMEAAGATIVKHYRELAFMGFAEVIMNIRTILRNFKTCKADIEAFGPDAIILIDYPGFNLRMAEWAHSRGIKVYYYISPQIWAWKQSRVEKVKKFVDRMFCVLPFEQAFYARFGYSADFVGHPLLDELQHTRADSDSDFRKRLGIEEAPIIGLFPGSRKQEISTMLPVMLDAARHFPDHVCVIAGAPGQTKDTYAPYLSDHKVKLAFGETYSIMRYARAGLVTSGTATLEAGLFKLPQAVCYKGNAISYAIARRLVKVKYISLVNLVLDRPAVRELIQHDMTAGMLRDTLAALLHDTPERKHLLEEYDALAVALGGGGASERTANEVLKSLEQSQ